VIAVAWFVFMGLLVAAGLRVWRELQEHRQERASGEEAAKELRNLRLRAAGVVLAAALAIAFVLVYNDQKREACLEDGRSYETGLFVRCE
jgi:hypothetical protein